MRVPAEEIEEIVISQMNSLLRSPQRMLDLLKAPTISDTQAVMNASREWATASTEKVRSIVKTAVARVVVRQDQIELKLSRAALSTLLAFGREGVESDVSEELVTIEIDAQLKRCGGEIRFQLSSDDGTAKSRPIPCLVRAVARAHDWMDRIMRGEPNSESRLILAPRAFVRRP
jgi:hypothetical protein